MQVFFFWRLHLFGNCNKMQCIYVSLDKIVSDHRRNIVSTVLALRLKRSTFSYIWIFCRMIFVLIDFSLVGDGHILNSEKVNRTVRDVTYTTLIMFAHLHITFGSFMLIFVAIFSRILKALICGIFLWNPSSTSCHHFDVLIHRQWSSGKGW